MRRITVVAIGLFCLIAVKPSSLVAGEKSVESAKADSGLRFLESGKGRSGVGEPSAVRAAAATSRASGLTASIASKRSIDSFQVPVPAVGSAARKEVPAASPSWSKRKIEGAVLGGSAATLLLPLAPTTLILPSIAVWFLIAGTIIATGAAIGYGIVKRAERAARRED